MSVISLSPVDGQPTATVTATVVRTATVSLACLQGPPGPQGPPGEINVVELSQAEYDALPTKEPNTIYLIT